MPADWAWLKRQQTFSRLAYCSQLQMKLLDKFTLDILAVNYAARWSFRRGDEMSRTRGKFGRDNVLFVFLRDRFSRANCL